MKFFEFSKCLEKLEITSGRINMTKLLATLFQRAESDEIDKICYLTLGRLTPLYKSVEFNIAEKMMFRILGRAYRVNEKRVIKRYKKLGDIGFVAQELATQQETKKHLGDNFSVVEVFAKLFEIATASGTGSQEKKIAWMAEILSQLDPLSVRFVARIPLGKLRLGVAGKTLIEALSWMLVGDKSLKSEIERVYFIYPDVGKIAYWLKLGGLKSLNEVKIEIGVPVLPALCQRIENAEEIIKKMGKVAIEPKFDGTRTQIHFSRKKKWCDPSVQTQFDFSEIAQGGFIKTFTRNLEETTHMFPDILTAVFEQVDAEEVILDAEAISYDPNTGRFRPFQETIQRKRKYDVAKKVKEFPLKLFVFDVLYKDGNDLLSAPFFQRRKILEAVIKQGKIIILTPQTITDDPAKLDNLLYDAIRQGLEGVVVKQVGAGYEAGARGFSWVKFKKEAKSELTDTIDCVVLGYERGTGKRTQFGIGSFLVGVYNENKGIFESISKVGTGLTDKQWRDMRKRCDEIRVPQKPVEVQVSKELFQDVWVEPLMVVEILADEITRSPIHKAGVRGGESGYALRFPRLVRWRDDKSADDATTVAEIKRLYKLQRKK